jgi:hypothetical protein
MKRIKLISIVKTCMESCYPIPGLAIFYCFLEHGEGSQLGQILLRELVNLNNNKSNNKNHRFQHLSVKYSVNA